MNLWRQKIGTRQNHDTGCVVKRHHERRLQLLAVSTKDFFKKTLSLLYLDQEQRVKSVMIGRLSPGDSFGEITVLKGLPMPCSVITDTHVQIGTISTLDVHGRYFDTSSPPPNPHRSNFSPPSPPAPNSTAEFKIYSLSWSFPHTTLLTPLILALCRMRVTFEPSTGLVHHRVSVAMQYSICAWNSKIWSSIPCVVLRPVFPSFVPRLLQSNYIFPHSKTELKIYDLSYSVYKLNKF